MALHIKVRRTRPRVYLSEYNLVDIAARIETTHLEEWSQLVVWSRGIAKAPREYRLRRERLGQRARRLAFMHAVRPEERLVGMALEIAPALIELTSKLSASPSGIEALAQLYDSFRARLPEELARDCAQALVKGAGALFGERIKGRPVLSEARSEAVASLMAAGLSLYVEQPPKQQTGGRHGFTLQVQRIIGQAVHASRDLIGTLQYFLEKDGGFPLGWAEGLTHLGQVPKLALLAESGLDQTWPRDVPWLERYTEFLEEGMEYATKDGMEDGTEVGAEDGTGDGVRSPDSGAPFPRTRRDERTTGPYWPGGGKTGPRRADLWRILAMVASESGAPSALRLLERVRLPGHQDERILYEKRPLPDLPEGEAAPQTRDRSPARLYRRAGLALFRGVDLEEGDTATRLEAVIRCPGALVAGGEALRVGSFSISCGGELLSGTERAPNGLVIDRAGGDKRTAEEKDGARSKSPSSTAAASRAAPFPRTRHEIGESEFHTSTIIAFESGVGSMLESGQGLVDWLRADLAPAHRGEVASAVRTFVMMRGLPAGVGAAFVVADEVCLRRENDGAAVVVFTNTSFTARPELDGNVVTVETRGVRLRGFVLQPDAAWISLDEAPESAGDSDAPAGDSTWRALVRLGGADADEAGPPERPGLERRACQVFVAERLDRPDHDRETGDREPLCVRLPSEGAVAVDVAGRVLVVGDPHLPRVECVTDREVDGVAVVGMMPKAVARLEVAGEEPVESETSGAGSVYFDCRIPAGTGVALTVEGEAE